MRLEKFKSKQLFPKFRPTNWEGIQKDAVQEDTAFYNRSDKDFKKRHGATAEGEKLFEAQTLKDQKGENELLPAVQNEFMRAGITDTLGSLGDSTGTLAPGSAGEAAVARNLGTSILGFQDRNRNNRQTSLAMAETLFPHREIGMSGKDVAGIQVADSMSINNWNQADYANKVQQEQFNYRIGQENARGAQTEENAQSQAAAEKKSANTQMAVGGGVAVLGIALLVL